MGDSNSDILDEEPERAIERIRKNYDLVDVVKDTKSIKSLRGFAVDTQEKVVGLVYQDDTAEVVPFDEFDDGEFAITGLQFN